MKKIFISLFLAIISIFSYSQTEILKYCFVGDNDSLIDNHGGRISQN